MKNYYLLVSLALACFCMASCSNDDEPGTEPEKGKTVEVSFKLGGDFVDTSYEPLTKAGTDPKTYYGIEVQYKEPGSSSYKHYAAGLFDNTNDMKITLETGNQYAFYCHVVKEGEDKLYFSSNNRSGTYPFSGLYLDNKFTVSTSSSSYNGYFNRTRSTIVDGSSYDSYMYNPRFEGIYYGVTTDYTPTSGGIINISLQGAKKYRCKYVINPPSDGSITVSGPDLTKTLSSTDNTYTETRPTRVFAVEYEDYHASYSFAYYYSDSQLTQSKRYNYITDFPTTDIYKAATVKITWNRANGATREYTQTVALKSNAVTTINVSVTDGDLGESQVKVNIPDDSNYGSYSQSVTVAGGELVDNTVNPN